MPPTPLRRMWRFRCPCLHRCRLWTAHHPHHLVNLHQTWVVCPLSCHPSPSPHTSSYHSSPPHRSPSSPHEYPYPRHIPVTLCPSHPSPHPFHSPTPSTSYPPSLHLPLPNCYFTDNNFSQNTLDPAQLCHRRCIYTVDMFPLIFVYKNYYVSVPHANCYCQDCHYSFWA